MAKNKIFMRITAVLLSGILLCLTACGVKEENNVSNGDDGTAGSYNVEDNAAGNGGGAANAGGGGAANAGGGTNHDGAAYAAQFFDLPCDAEADYVSYSGGSFADGRFYYVYGVKGAESSSTWCYIDMGGQEMKLVTVLDLAEYTTGSEGWETGVAGVAACEDGGTVLLLRTQPEAKEDESDAAYARRQRETTYSVKKIAADGTEVFDTDITEYLQRDMGSGNGMQEMQIFTDKEGAVYVSDAAGCIWMFDKEGGHTADIRLPAMQGTAAVGMLPDGRIGVLHQGNGMHMEAYDSATGQLSGTYAGLPSECLLDFGTGAEGSIFLYSKEALYAYSMTDKAYKELAKWADYGINADYIRQVGALADGRIVIYSQDWSADKNSLILLEKTAASQKAGKEVLTLGCEYASPFLRASVVQFNKTNEAYKIEIKSYSGEEARMLLYSDILTGNAPDMFIARDIDISLFAVKGLLEDLSPYLENSAVVRREDLFEPVLNAYTVEDTLCAIPVNFCVQTLAGRTSEVGEETGWTIMEMIAFAEAHPETPILPSATKTKVLETCLLHDFDSWVNWETGECLFGTPEFKALLEFANSYPAEEDESLPMHMTQVMEHQALLYEMRLQNFKDWQIPLVLFQEPITAIGYPSAYTSGVLVVGYDEVCISASSPNKEAAWSFIETLLTEEAQEDVELSNGIPIRLSTFEKKLAEAMEPRYLLDANGEIQLDENGEPIQKSNYGISWGDKIVDLYAVTQEEADSIRQVISRIGGRNKYNDSLMEIIMEEAASYFAGQKSVDEVTDIIENRVQLYMNESR